MTYECRAGRAKMGGSREGSRPGSSGWYARECVTAAGVVEAAASETSTRQ